MPTPTSRSKILPARGLKANLDAGLVAGDLLEGELCYAKDEDALYQVEGGVLVKVGGGLQSGDNVSELVNDAGYITAAEVPADAVTSVNGQTGVVSLGIQDMDDFELNTAPPAGLVYQTSETKGIASPEDGEYSWTDQHLTLGEYDENGLRSHDEQLAVWGDNAAVDRPVWIAINTVNNGEYVQYTSSQFFTPNASLGILRIYFGAGSGWNISDATLAAAGTQITVSFSDPGVPVDVDLVEGDILAWNTAATKFRPAQLETVATSGDYNDLTNTPALAAVATSGSYNDLTDQPTIPTQIQDQDDFQLNVGAVVINTWNNGGTGGSADVSTGEVVRSSSSSFNYFISRYDANGVDVYTPQRFPSTTDLLDIWYSTDGGSNWTADQYVGYDLGSDVLLMEQMPANLVDNFVLSFTDPALVPDAPLAEGDFLKWNNSEEVFKPTQLATVATSGSYNDLTDQPTIPAAAPVDSVNGQTGVVSLGVQDMDDFELLQDQSNVYRYTWQGGDVGDGSHYTANFSGTIKDILKYVDMDGKDSTANLPADDTVASVWHSFDQVNWTEVSGTWNRVDLTERIDLTGAELPRTYGGSLYITWTDPATIPSISLAEGDILQWNDTDSKFNPAQVATVAISGSYNDLTDQPTSWSDGTGGDIYYNSGSVGIGLSADPRGIVEVQDGDIYISNSAATDEAWKMTLEAGTGDLEIGSWNDGSFFTAFTLRRSLGLSQTFAAINSTSANSPLDINWGLTATDRPTCRLREYRPAIRLVDLSTDQDDGEMVMDGSVMRWRIGDESAGAISDPLVEKMTLDASGNLTAVGNVTAYSDINLKENVEIIPNALEKVSAIRGVTYDRKDVEGPRQAGVIAQEVEAVLPEVVMTNEDGIKSVAYGNLVGLLIEAVKELKAEVETLKAERN